jgi:O-antigen/teichoic acid export membrane protein
MTMLSQVLSRTGASRAVGFAKRQRRYIHATSLYFGERLIFIVLNFIVYAVVARSYGPTPMGVLAYAQAIVQFGAPFLAAGCEPIIIRELLRNPDRHNDVIGAAFLNLMLMGLAITALPLLYIVLSHPGDHLLIVVSLFLTLAFVPNSLLVIEHDLKARLRAVPIVLTRIVVMSVATILKLWLVAAGFSIVAIAAMTALEAFVLAGAFVALYVRSGRSLHSWRFRRDDVGFLFRQMMPMMLSGFVVMVFFRINHILVAQFGGYGEVGQYAVAFQMAQLFGILPMVFFTAVYPRLVAVHSSDEQQFRDMTRWLYTGFSALGYLIAAAVYIVGDRVVALAFGPQFALAGALLFILAIGNVFNYSGAVRAQVINIGNIPHYHVWNAAVGLLVIVPASLYLLPRVGVVGAAWSMTGSALISGVLTSFLFRRTRTTGADAIRGLFLLPPRSSGLSAKAPQAGGPDGRCLDPNRREWATHDSES